MLMSSVGLWVPEYGAPTSPDSVVGQSKHRSATPQPHNTPPPHQIVSTATVPWVQEYLHHLNLPKRPKVLTQLEGRPSCFFYFSFYFLYFSFLYLPVFAFFPFLSSFILFSLCFPLFFSFAFLCSLFLFLPYGNLIFVFFLCVPLFLSDFFVSGLYAIRRADKVPYIYIRSHSVQILFFHFFYVNLKINDPEAILQFLANFSLSRKESLVMKSPCCKLCVSGVCNALPPLWL
jgi:hypothetical protein